MVYDHAARTGACVCVWGGGGGHAEASRNDHLGPVTSVGEWMEPPSPFTAGDGRRLISN